MSYSTKNTSFNFDNSNENSLNSNEQSYIDLINLCSIRKQFTRIIPSCYIEVKKYQNSKLIPTQNIEEFTKLKEEINLMKEKIDLLKYSKEKKIQQIEELRCLMRKVANKEVNSKEKEIINNYFNGNCEIDINSKNLSNKGVINPDIEGNVLLQPIISSEFYEGKGDGDSKNRGRIKSNILPIPYDNIIKLENKIEC